MESPKSAPANPDEKFCRERSDLQKMVFRKRLPRVREKVRKLGSDSGVLSIFIWRDLTTGRLEISGFDPTGETGMDIRPVRIVAL